MIFHENKNTKYTLTRGQFYLQKMSFLEKFEINGQIFGYNIPNIILNLQYNYYYTYSPIINPFPPSVPIWHV